MGAGSGRNFGNTKGSDKINGFPKKFIVENKVNTLQAIVII